MKNWLKELIRNITIIIEITIILATITWVLGACIITIAPMWADHDPSIYLTDYENPKLIDDIDILMMYYHITDSYRLRLEISQYLMSNEILEGRRRR